MNRAFASAFGALFATMLALEFDGSFLAVALSLLSGGIMAWIGCDIPGFARGVKQAWQVSRSRWGKIEWQRVWPSLSYTASVALSTAIITASAFSLPMLVQWRWDMEGFALLALATLATTTCSLGIAMEDSYGDRKLGMNGLWNMSQRSWKNTLLYRNPVAWCVWGAVFVGISFMAVLELLKEMPLFLRLAFVYTHSEKRKLCFIDAVVGGVVGLYFEMPLVGMVVGGVMGYLHYPLTRKWVAQAQTKPHLEALPSSK